MLGPHRDRGKKHRRRTKKGVETVSASESFATDLLMDTCYLTLTHLHQQQPLEKIVVVNRGGIPLLAEQWALTKMVPFSRLGFCKRQFRTVIDTEGAFHLFHREGVRIVLYFAHRKQHCRGVRGIDGKKTPQLDKRYARMLADYGATVFECLQVDDHRVEWSRLIGKVPPIEEVSLTG